MLNKNVFEKIARRFSKLSFFNQWKFKIEAGFFFCSSFPKRLFTFGISAREKIIISIIINTWP